MVQRWLVLLTTVSKHHKKLYAVKDKPRPQKTYFLLRYNLNFWGYSINLKCTFQSVLTKTQDISVTLESSLRSLPSQSPPHPTPRTKQPLLCLCHSMLMLPTLGIHMSGIIWESYFALSCFSSLMILRLIHIVAFTSSPILLLLSSIPLFKHTIVYLSVFLLIGIYHIVFFILNHHTVKLVRFPFDVQAL